MALDFDAADWDDRFVDLAQARMDLAQGQVEAAARWARARLPRQEDGGGFMTRHLQRYEDPVLARLALARGRPGETLVLLDPLLALGQRLGRVDTTIKVEVLRALALQAAGDVRAALAALEHALSLAEPGGYLRAFVDEGAQMAPLLRRAAARGAFPDYAARLLAVLDQECALPQPHDQPLVEPLSARELEVLRLLSAGLANKQIAETLVIAVGTVRKHLKNVYGKLDVHSRTQAVARARELGLLSGP